jgi:hypothetical protein
VQSLCRFKVHAFIRFCTFSCLAFPIASADPTSSKPQQLRPLFFRTTVECIGLGQEPFEPGFVDMKCWIRSVLLMVLAVLGCVIAGRASGTHLLAFFHSASASVAPKHFSSMSRSNPRTCRNSLLVTRYCLQQDRKSGACRPLLSCNLSLRGGDWSREDESIARNPSTLHEFHDEFESLRAQMEASNRMGEDEWQHLQASMANTARKFIEWCRSLPGTASDGARGILVVLEGLDKSGKSTQVYCISPRIIGMSLFLLNRDTCNFTCVRAHSFPSDKAYRRTKRWIFCAKRCKTLGET